MNTGDYLVLRHIFDTRFDKFDSFRVEVYDKETLEMKEIVIEVDTTPIRSFDYLKGDILIKQDDRI